MVMRKWIVCLLFHRNAISALGYEVVDITK